MSEQTHSTVPDDYLHDDVQAVAQYRSVSGLAVLAAVLGICSPLAIFSSGLLVVPLLGTIVSCLALWRIAASEGQLAGRTAALVGLALSVAIGAGVYVRGVTLERLVATEAEQWALEWCDLVLDDKLLIAMELRNPPEARRPFDESLAEYYETNDAASTALAEFRDDPAIQALTAAPDGSHVAPGELVGVAPDGQGGYFVVQVFQLLPAGGGGAPVDLRLQLNRSRLTGAGGGAWYLTDHALVE